VRVFAQAGADVVIASRRLEACEAVAQEVEAMGRRALPVAVQVSRWDENDMLAERAYAAFGRIDVLVNAAGISAPPPVQRELSEAQFDKVVGVNFKGPFRLCMLVGEKMMAGDGGAIVNLSSYSAFASSRDGVPYAGARAAIHAMTTSLASAFAPKVRVNCIAPGPFLADDSGMRLDDEAHLHVVGLKRYGHPEEIVGAALYLASDASSFTSGAIIRVDGGVW
jgi:NAD(P)-dependent dehydrogenase (short-subunit alcohol dehydrogenase family)